MALPVPTLVGDHVRLEPLVHEHADDLVTAATESRSTYRWTAVPADRPAMMAYIDHLFTEHAGGRVVPFVQRRVSDGQLVGCTRFMDLRWWSGADTPDEAEVGGTWLAASAQRTPINTEAKLLLFTYAFETWRVGRLCLCTDARNDRSRAAIARAGATFEGVLRHHRASYASGEEGLARDTAIYSIIPTEWPSAKAALRARLG